ncbi:Gti1/Pac2 family-domain-containing protein [Chytriomyces cf. hyalinus JEL632]|nr:Gti1/Pac2 family-domain-containing protein [Chytriomyces cf. hyalinus JEL632]
MIPAGAETPNRFDITSKANQDSKASADKRHKQLPEASDLTQHPKKPRHLRKQHDQNQIAFTHSFFGFIENPMDALLVIEGCIRSNLRLFTGSAADMARTPIQSGTVIVIPANCAFVKRWRDGIHWSPSRSFGPFLLYRQVEPTYTNESHPAGPKYAPKRVQSNVAALEPTFSARTLKPNTRLVENGLTKRTITLKGSDGQKHRIVSYYCPVDVVEMSRLEAELKTGGSSSRPQQSGLLNAPPDEMFQRPMGDSRLCAISADKSVNLTTLLELSVSNSFNGDIDTEERLEHASNDAFLKRVADASDGEDGHDRQSSKRATAQKSGRDESLNEPINHHEPEYHSQTIYLENGVQSLNPPSFHSFSHPSTFLHHSTHPMGVYPPFLIAHYPLNHQPGQLPLSQQPTQQFHGMPGQPASMYQDSLHVTYGGYY